MESGYRQAIVVSLVLEIATVLLLGGFLLGLSAIPRAPRPAGS
jgi:hypothetical protein